MVRDGPKVGQVKENQNVDSSSIVWKWHHRMRPVGSTQRHSGDVAPLWLHSREVVTTSRDCVIALRR